MTDDELDEWLARQPPLTDAEKAEILYSYLLLVLDGKHAARGQHSEGSAKAR